MKSKKQTFLSRKRVIAAIIAGLLALVMILSAAAPLFLWQ